MKRNLLESKILFVLFLVPFLLFAPPANASEAEVAKYPSRPVTYIVPVPPGGGTDLAIRIIAKEAEKFLGQPIVIVNKPGGTLTIGVAAIATAKPDGYTIGYAGGPPLYLTPFLERVPYNPLKDLQAIMQFGSYNFGVVVKADSPFKSFKDLIDYARLNPKKVTYGTSGTNSLQHITMERIAKKEGVKITHIPFKGTTESQTALLGGHIIAAVGDFNYTLVESGEIRILLLLKEEPSAEYPGSPILKDLGYDYPYPLLFNVFGPKGMPEGIIKKIEEAFTKAMKQPTFINGMKELRLPIVYRNSKELNDYIVYNYKSFEKLLKELGLIK